MTDLSSYRDIVAKFGKDANEAEANKNYYLANEYYTKALEVFNHMIKYEKNPKLVEIYKRKAREYFERTAYLKMQVLQLENVSQGDGSAAARKPKGPSGGGGGGDKDTEETKKLYDALSSAIVREKPNVKWTEVAGLEKAKATLQEAVILPTKFPQLFTGERKPWRGILLYGPPGTGKTHLAKACATEADGTFFSISCSVLVRKPPEESARLVKLLFKLARENKPAIIFIDEIESLCSSRSEIENETSRRIETEFLVQMQCVGNDNDGILVLGASNVPWELDPAIRRQFEKRIYIPLPDIHSRVAQFQIRLCKTPNNLTEDDLIDLAKETEGYSGYDITVVAKEAMMMPVRRCQIAVKFRQCPDGFFEPTNPTDPYGRDMTLFQVEPAKLRAPKVTTEDFYQAISHHTPQVSFDDLQRQIEFTSKFEQDL